MLPRIGRTPPHLRDATGGKKKSATRVHWHLSNTTVAEVMRQLRLEKADPTIVLAGPNGENICPELPLMCFASSGSLVFVLEEPFKVELERSGQLSTHYYSSGTTIGEIITPFECKEGNPLVAKSKDGMQYGREIRLDEAAEELNVSDKALTFLLENDPLGVPDGG